MGIHIKSKYFLSYIITWTLKYFVFFWVRSCQKALQASGHLLNCFLLKHTFIFHIQTKQGLLLDTLQQTGTLHLLWKHWFVSCYHWANFLLSLRLFYEGSNKNRIKIRKKFTPCTCTLSKRYADWWQTAENKWSHIFFQILFLNLIHLKAIFLLQFNVSSRNNTHGSSRTSERNDKKCTITHKHFSGFKVSGTTTNIWLH